jgi:hypothetical protein
MPEENAHAVRSPQFRERCRLAELGKELGKCETSEALPVTKAHP